MSRQESNFSLKIIYLMKIILYNMYVLNSKYWRTSTR